MIDTGGTFALIRWQVLLGFALMVCSHFAVTDARLKRSDDPNPLQQVVQQQAQDIQRQAAELTTLHNTVTTLHSAVTTLQNSLTSLQNTVTTLQSSVQELRATAKKTVSFSAYSSKTIITTENKGIYVFDAAVSNIGNDYDILSGIFTAPYSGTYLFLLDIMLPNNSSDGTAAAMEKSGTVLAMAYTTKENAWDKDACHVTVRLNAGDKVWVRHDAGVQSLYGGFWSTFTGMLIHAD